MLGTGRVLCAGAETASKPIGHPEQYPLFNDLFAAAIDGVPACLIKYPSQVRTLDAYSWDGDVP